MKLYISSDHAGFELKKHLVGFLEQRQSKNAHNGDVIEVIDLGPHEYNPDDDYPDWIARTARAVSDDASAGTSADTVSRGIVIGLSGQGEAMVANRYPHVRAGVYYGGSEEILTLLREHNDSNILSLGAKFVSPEMAEKAIMLWLATLFTSDPRHERRIAKIETSVKLG